LIFYRTINYTNYSDLDVYYDSALIHSRRPVVVHVHGGGWCEGKYYFNLIKKKFNLKIKDVLLIKLILKIIFK